MAMTTGWRGAASAQDEEGIAYCGLPWRLSPANQSPHTARGGTKARPDVAGPVIDNGGMLIGCRSVLRTTIPSIGQHKHTKM